MAHLLSIPAVNLISPAWQRFHRERFLFRITLKKYLFLLYAVIHPFTNGLFSDIYSENHYLSRGVENVYRQNRFGRNDYFGEKSGRK
jgi:hypothetical protein